jgi:hypothetical protein
VVVLVRVRDLFGDDLTPNVACKAAQQTTEAVIVKVESPDVQLHFRAAMESHYQYVSNVSVVCPSGVLLQHISEANQPNMT